VSIGNTRYVLIERPHKRTSNIVFNGFNGNFSCQNNKQDFRTRDSPSSSQHRVEIVGSIMYGLPTPGIRLLYTVFKYAPTLGFPYNIRYTVCPFLYKLRRFSNKGSNVIIDPRFPFFRPASRCHTLTVFREGRMCHLINKTKR